MTKSEATRIIIKCAEAYHSNLENTNLLITYREGGKLCSFKALFLPRHFLHLTGAKIIDNRIGSSVHFYSLCLDHRLSNIDYEFASDGTTPLKLAVLPFIMRSNLSANMIGDFREHSLALYTQKIAGSIKACIGFTLDENVGYFVPNTVLQRDTREVTQGQYSRILTISQKAVAEDQYAKCVYRAKGIAPDYLFTDF